MPCSIRRNRRFGALHRTGENCAARVALAVRDDGLLERAESGFSSQVGSRQNGGRARMLALRLVCIFQLKPAITKLAQLPIYWMAPNTARLTFRSQADYFKA